MASLQAQSTGEDSNGSDHSVASDDGELDDMNGSLDQRSFQNFLGLQNIPGLLPGPSGIHGADGFGKFKLDLLIFLIIFYCRFSVLFVLLVLLVFIIRK